MTEGAKLQKMLNEIKLLISKRSTTSDIDFTTWRNKVQLFLANKFGEKSLEYKKFSNIGFYEIDYGEKYGLGKTVDQVEVCKKGLMIAEGMLKTILEDIEGFQNNQIKKKDSQLSYKRIFIVHGHDGELKEAVARIIEKQNIEAVILGEKANQGRTIIEKFENYSDVGGAICLFTADDIGCEKSKSDGHPRARQNVVFEAGYFMGKLGRNHVVLLADSGVEMPSDLSGVVYTNTANWQFELLKELNAMGYKVDMNKLL